jgi:hypothetical protein
MSLFSSHNWPSQCNDSEIELNNVTSYSNQNLKKTKNNNKHLLCDWLSLHTVGFRQSHGSKHFLALCTSLFWFLPAPQEAELSRGQCSSTALLEDSRCTADRDLGSPSSVGRRRSGTQAVGAHHQAPRAGAWSACLQALESYLVCELLAVASLAAAVPS